MIGRYVNSRRRQSALCVAFGAIVALAGGIAGARPREPDPQSAARAVVDAVNAVVWVDVPIAAAAAARCPLDRLPAGLGDLLPHVPAEHRPLVEECVRGRLRVRHEVRGFDLRDVIDAESGESSELEPLAGLFAGRVVDVALGAALSDEPYPIAFDWAVVLDVESHTLFSFVLNCRD